VLLHLVRHGPPVIVPGIAASRWALDTSNLTELLRLRGVLGQRARRGSWHSSDEPKAVATAHLLTDGEVNIVAALREVVRSDWFERRDDFATAVHDAFQAQSRPARSGWEPLITLVSGSVRLSPASSTAPAVTSSSWATARHGRHWCPRSLAAHLTWRPGPPYGRRTCAPSTWTSAQSASAGVTGSELTAVW
jgi:hypothetical protein